MRSSLILPYQLGSPFLSSDSKVYFDYLCEGGEMEMILESSGFG